MQIFSGSSSQALAKKIAHNSKIKLGEVELSQFPNNEVRVWVKEKKVDREVAVIQSFVGDPNKSILEFCLLVDALRRSGAQDITAIIPWMGYCIQDKVFRKGEPLSARVVADIVQSVRPNKIITIDLHNEAIQGFFSIPVVHLTGSTVLIETFKHMKEIDTVIAPDVGALKESTKIAQHLNLPITILNKQRDLVTGKVSIAGVDGQIKGKTALIMDDFISTGGTLIQTAKFLKDNEVRNIYVGVTHHLFVKGVQEKIEKSDITKLFITDSIEVEQNSITPKLNILSISNDIVNELY